MGELAGRALGYRIRAVVKSDDGQKSANFCAWNWFDTLHNEDIVELHGKRYRGECADACAHYAHEVENNNGVGQVFSYLTTYKPRTPRGAIVGFECVIKTADVYKYLAERRPQLAADLFPDGEPGAG